MKFSQKQLDEIHDALLIKGVDKPCNACGSTELVVITELILLDQSKPGNFPAIVTGCGNCGKMQFFGAKTLVPGLFA
ncbi:hypothetical protein ACQCT5_10420 [Sutcliffiella halmapala]